MFGFAAFVTDDFAEKGNEDRDEKTTANPRSLGDRFIDRVFVW
jgi:hypothetical protein